MSVYNGSDIYNEGGLTEADVQSIIDNTPNIKNVQSDWNATSGDAAILNKPFYRKYTGGTSTYYKVCTMSKSGSSSTEMYGFEILARKYNGGIYGTLLYKNTLKLILNSVSNVSIDADYIRLYALVGDSTVTIYVRAFGYVSLQAAPLVNLPKSNVDFTDFGTVVSGLPEGATEITSVWSVTSTGSSGDIPAKVNEYGLLSPVTMDNYPTSGSTGLVNSGKLYDVFTDDNSDQMTETPPKQVYVTGKFYFIAGKVCRCTAYSATSATFDVYGVVEALNYVLGQI